MNLTRSLFHAETHMMTHTLHDNSHMHYMFNIVRASLSPRGGTCYVTLHPSTLAHGTTRTLLTRRQRSNRFMYPTHYRAVKDEWQDAPALKPQR
jgi:hypothetical protein